MAPLGWRGSGRCSVGVLPILAALGTAFYMSRLYFLVFSGKSRADAETQHHIQLALEEFIISYLVIFLFILPAFKLVINPPYFV